MHPRRARASKCFTDCFMPCIEGYRPMDVIGYNPIGRNPDQKGGKPMGPDIPMDMFRFPWSRSYSQRGPIGRMPDGGRMKPGAVWGSLEEGGGGDHIPLTHAWRKGGRGLYPLDPCLSLVGLGQSHWGASHLCAHASHSTSKLMTDRVVMAVTCSGSLTTPSKVLLESAR